MVWRPSCPVPFCVLGSLISLCILSGTGQIFRHGALVNCALHRMIMVGDQTFSSGDTLEGAGLAHQEFWPEQYLVMGMVFGILGFF